MSQKKVVECYKKASLRRETVERFERIQDLVHFYLGEDMLMSRCGSLVLSAGLVQRARYPAIQWFDNYFLRSLIAVLPPLRFLMQVITPYSQFIGVKHNKIGDLS